MNAKSAAAFILLVLGLAASCAGPRPIEVTAQGSEISIVPKPVSRRPPARLLPHHLGLPHCGARRRPPRRSGRSLPGRATSFGLRARRSHLGRAARRGAGSDHHPARRGRKPRARGLRALGDSRRRGHRRSGSGGDVLWRPDAAPASPSRGLRLGRRRGRCRLPALRQGRGQAPLPLARHAAGRLAALLPQGVRQALSRPPGPAQDEHLPLAPDRRPGLADRDQEVPEADRGRGLAGDREDQHWNSRPPQGRATGHATAASTPRTTSARSWPTRRAGTSPSCPRSRCPATARRPWPPTPSFRCTGGPFTVHAGGVFRSGRLLRRQRRDVRVPGGRAGGGASSCSRASSSTSAATRCPRTSWKACPKCQARIKADGLKDEDELQSYFIRRIETFLDSTRPDA